MTLIAISNHKLERDQDGLNSLTDHDAAVGDIGHDRDEHDPEAHLDDRVLGEIIQTEKAQSVDGSDLGDIGQNDDRRDGDAPAAQPTIGSNALVPQL